MVCSVVGIGSGQGARKKARALRAKVTSRWGYGLVHPKAPSGEGASVMLFRRRHYWRRRPSHLLAGSFTRFGVSPRSTLQPLSWPLDGCAGRR